MPRPKPELGQPCSLKLVLEYRTPSLNVTKRQHWSEQMREKRKAMFALQCALLGTGSDRWIQITSRAVSKTCLTAYDTLTSYLATNRGASNWKRSRPKSASDPQKELK